ncbi:Protein SPT2-like [Quillaja saponaria]|uniref:Protein SPT2-like n=1 Tax=Quillaja saponaria TaxID=32244 RepID=A0AAD7L8A7_QUISA|nr:Protein SPT2-like [Quillaja saponaria]
MRGYDELEDYDDYEDEGDEQEYEDEEEEEEEEQPRKPTKEELEYLELRQRLKESIRKQMKKEKGSAYSNSSKKKLPYDNYGSFFGPSQPVIAQRVIQESKSLLETQHLASRVSNSHHVNKNKTTNGASRPSAINLLPKIRNEQTKVQKLKDTRDYSFLLSDDAELPAPRKELPPRKVSVPTSEGRPSQVPGKSKQPLRDSGKHIQGDREDRRLASVSGQLHPKAGSSNKFTYSNKQNLVSTDSRKQLGRDNGSGPGLPVGQKGLPSRAAVTAMENKSSIPGIKNNVNGMQKPLSSKMQSSAPKHHLQQKKEPREPIKPKIMPKQPVTSSKPQINKPLKQNPSRTTLQDHRFKKKPVDQFSDDEDARALSELRQMFRFRRDRYVDDDDDSDMEAGFEDIMREERRSAKIARKEDEEQLRLIEEEEKRERQRKLAKRRKLG